MSLFYRTNLSAGRMSHFYVPIDNVGFFNAADARLNIDGDIDIQLKDRLKDYMYYPEEYWDMVHNYGNYGSDTINSCS